MTFDTPELTRILEGAETDALEAIRWISTISVNDRMEALIVAASLSKLAAVASAARERVLCENPYTPPSLELETVEKPARKRRKVVA